MAASIKNWIDNSPPQCAAADLNGFKLENNNLIESVGQTLNATNRFQSGVAVSAYAANGDFYVDTGIANAYVLAVQTLGMSPYIAPIIYFNGMRARFFAGNQNTGASTVNVAGLGVKAIVDRAGNALAGGEIEAAKVVQVTYDQTNNRFILTDDGSASSTGVPTGSVIDFAGILANIPPDYLYCDSSAISRTTFAKLFGIIGITWGAGDTVTTFNIPDQRGRGRLGSGTGAGLTNRVLATYLGAEQIFQAGNQVGSHAHTVNGGTPVVVNSGGFLSGGATFAAAGQVVFADASPAPVAMNLMNPFAVYNTIIKV